MLPDDMLLDIFSFHVDKARTEDEWHTLVHVCRRWRNLVFASPRHLRLTLLCTPRRPVREMLDIWPALPISVRGPTLLEEGVDNIIAALERNDRVCQITLTLPPGSQLEQFMAVVQRPFPVLTDLCLTMYHGWVPGWARWARFIPDSFLGGCAPRLRHLSLMGMPFPKPLFSAPDPVILDLGNLPHSGYFSSEAMVAYLSVLTRLESLYLGCDSPQFLPDLTSQHSPPLRRAVLPTLTSLRLWLQGVSEWLEDVFSRIDVPLLNEVTVNFCTEPEFYTPQLVQLLSRTDNLKESNRAIVRLQDQSVEVALSRGPGVFDHPMLTLRISCSRLYRQSFSLARLCGSSLPPLSHLERLDIYDHRSSNWQGYIGDTEWLELLHQFTSVNDLYLFDGLAPRVAPALQELVGQRVTEVLPALQNLFLAGSWRQVPVPAGILKFIAARQLSGHPVAVNHWERGVWVVDALGGL
ncbi:hypothetical protein BJV74DRAFT_864873 [Russula compacta]|nr:hypothetical protein BJV74DRAFT_864873 [Russula compacta]